MSVSAWGECDSVALGISSLEVSADAPKKKSNLEDCTTGPCGTEDVWERAHSLEVNELCKLD